MKLMEKLDNLMGTSFFRINLFVFGVGFGGVTLFFALVFIYTGVWG